MRAHARRRNRDRGVVCRIAPAVCGNLVIREPVTWAFFSNHGYVLLYVDAHPDARLRDIALAVDITERTVHHIISQLAEEGYVSLQRVGRRTSYTVHRQLPLRHPLAAKHSLGELLDGLDTGKRSANPPASERLQ